MTSRSMLAPLVLVGLCACPSALAPPRAVIRAGSSTEIDGEADCQADPDTRIDTQVGVAAALHAACSDDPNGLTLSYHWQIVDQPNGSAIELPNDAVISPTVIPDLAGRYRLSLVVSDGTLTSPAAYVTLDAREPDNLEAE